MKAGQVWSVEYDSYVSRTFMPRDRKRVKLDIAKCIIKISSFGYYELWINGRYLKNINFTDYQKYKKFVMKVIGEEPVA